MKRILLLCALSAGLFYLLEVVPVRVYPFFGDRTTKDYGCNTEHILSVNPKNGQVNAEPNTQIDLTSSITESYEQESEQFLYSAIEFQDRCRLAVVWLGSSSNDPAGIINRRIANLFRTLPIPVVALADMNSYPLGGQVSRFARAGKLAFAAPLSRIGEAPVILTRGRVSVETSATTAWQIRLIAPKAEF